MDPTPPPATTGAGAGAEGTPGRPSVGLGPALRRAWVGYQVRLDAAMAEAGFEDRKLPDGRVLRMCSGPSGATISAVGRELGITRQGAGKVVERLRERGYVSVADSATSGREKSVVVTPRGTAYLQAQRTAARSIEEAVQAEVGEAAVSGLLALLGALDPGEPERLRTYLRRSG